MFLEILKKDSKEIYNYSDDSMIPLITLYREGIVYADYENFIHYLNDNNLPILIFDLLEIDKIDNNNVILSNCYHPNENVLKISTSEVIKITDMVMDLMQKEWETIRIEFDGTTFDILVDDKPYL
jgi:hypothetical protein